MSGAELVKRIKMRLKYGPAGSPIEDSRFVRGYCRACGDPLRVRPQDVCWATCKTCRAVI